MSAGARAGALRTCSGEAPVPLQAQSWGPRFPLPDSVPAAAPHRSLSPLLLCDMGCRCLDTDGPRALEKCLRYGVAQEEETVGKALSLGWSASPDLVSDWRKGSSAKIIRKPLARQWSSKLVLVHLTPPVYLCDYQKFSKWCPLFQKEKRRNIIS